MTQSMLYIRLTSNMREKTAAVYSYQSSMSMIEKNAKKKKKAAFLPFTVAYLRFQPSC